MENKSLFDVQDVFFVIDSYNLDQTETKLYGFTLLHNTLIQDAATLHGEEPTGDGAYVYVHRTAECINIRQDFMGSYGLYLYRHGDYFALSNSFLRLVDHLKEEHPITLNKDYSNFFISADLCSVVFGETMIQEIECLDRSAQVEIDILRKQVDIRLFDYLENTVELSTEEGMNLLDAWYYKWTGFIRNLCSKGIHVQADLSGGFDSRMTFMLLLGSGINLGNTLIKSLNDGLHVHDEDYEIASIISEYYQFSLNNASNLDNDSRYYSMEDILNISFYLKLCFHKQMYFRNNFLKKSRHCFSGSGGECLRAYWNMSAEEYIENAVRRCRIYPAPIARQMEKSIRQMLTDTFDRIRKKFESFGRSVAPEDMTLYLYRETRCRNHFGKDILENYCYNVMKYTPLLDPIIHRLKRKDSHCSDNNLLAAILLCRYQPALLDFKFEGGREIAPQTVAYAKELNKRFPFDESMLDKAGTKKISQVSMRPSLILPEGENQHLPGESISGMVKQILSTGAVRGAFIGLYGSQVYDILCGDIASRKYQPLQNAYTIIGISKILQDIQFQLGSQCTTAGQFLISGISSQELTEESPILQNNVYLDNYITARIDITKTLKIPDTLNTTAPGAVELMEVSDPNARIIVPSWLSETACGYTVESKSGTLELKLRCLEAGMLTISLKGRDVRRADNSRIPLWIDYHSVKINDKPCIKDIQSVWHDAPLNIIRETFDGEIIDLYLEWNLHDERRCTLPPKTKESFTRKVKALLKSILNSLAP